MLVFVITKPFALLQEVEITKSGKQKGAKKAAKGAAAARAAAASKLRRSTSITTPGTSPGLAAPPALESFANNVESAGESSSPPSLTSAITGGKLASNSTSQTQVVYTVPSCPIGDLHASITILHSYLMRSADAARVHPYPSPVERRIQLVLQFEPPGQGQLVSETLS